MAQNITLMGASYSAVPAVTLPKTGGGTASFTDVTPTTATDSDVASGKVYFKSDGTQSTGTASGSSVTVESFTVTSAGTHTAPTGKAYSPVIVGSGAATAPASISSSGATASNNGTNIVLTKTVSVTPSVTAGYIASGTAGNCAITMQATDANFLAENIKSGVSLFGKTGSYTGGGGTSKNTQVVQGTTRTTSSTLTAIGAEMTVSKTGTYDIYWSAFRSSTSSSYTYGTQLYIDGSAHGTQNTTWSNHVQNNHLTSVSLTANQKLRVYGRESRGSSYYIYAPTLVIVEK